ncbi:putative Peptidyl-prolyl cis-trans isomerase H [Blattamonas nauphoetae]|uniref:Peptidyl-prolyl cis-trans isomerase n=1 Tax=Blattamonas nauphoetae TaxID=2049346 RepID=A0ABQ9WTY7_9EUKA|nr:putative Peptidyl-prolyl cis-trans isomerase H [Blattamonas nauphoetae]
MIPQHQEPNPIAFFDISVGGTKMGRVEMELFADKCPKTAKNFLTFCTGEFERSHRPVGYKGCRFHRVLKDFMVQGGDFVNRDGTGLFSLYGDRFPDENFLVKHDCPGRLSMANNGPNSNGCQFFITCKPTPWLDGKNVCFGQVIKGMEVIRIIEQVSVRPPNSVPKVPIEITECGQM